MYYVYLLKLGNNTIYAGYSDNLKKRIKAHQLGRVHATKFLLPCKLLFYASFSNKIRALKFEKYLKSSSGFAFRNKHLI